MDQWTEVNDMSNPWRNHYDEAAAILAGRELLDPDEAGLAQAHALLAVADAIKALTASVQGGGF
jgi:hypothetical protein